MRTLPLLSLCVLLLSTTACTGVSSILGGGGWTTSAHPCAGNRTDAMWFDDEHTGFVGCGTTTEGYGLYTTTNGGSSWSLVPSPNDFLSTMRVNSLSRGADGKLYVGGIGDNGARVVTLLNGELSEFYLTPSSGVQVWQGFQVGTFRIDSNGRAVSESLTGSDVMYWPSATGGQVTAADAVNGYGWWEQATIEGSGAQILDLEVHGDRFYGVGSTISQPPYFFYEPASGFPEDGFALQAIRLSDDGLAAFDGEVWDIAIDTAGDMLLAGVNENSNTAVAWFNTGDPTAATSWIMVDMSAILTSGNDDATRFYGACRAGNLMVAVGDYSQRGNALLMLSQDGGATWTEQTPPTSDVNPVGPLSKCQFLGQKAYITGADGFFGVLDVAGI